MIHRRKRLYSLRRGTVLLLVLLLAPITIAAGEDSGNWADAFALPRIGEYLALQFKVAISRPETDSLNSFSVVNFYPSSDPQDAIVVVLQTWRDERLGAEDLRREIRKVSDALVLHFKAMVGSPAISRLWRVGNPKENLVINHVRFSDLRETLGVTLRGETAFDTDSIAKAKKEVVARGGYWPR